MSMPDAARPAAVALVLLASLLLAAPATHAAFPVAGGSYTVHDHETKGKNWHVEVEVSPKSRLKARTVVVYVQECRATPFANGARIDLKGRLVIQDRTFDLPKGAGQGTWSIQAAFTSEHELTGTYRIVTPTCDSGLRTFTAHTPGHGKHSHHHSGTRPGQYPGLAAASRAHRSQARTLWRNTLQAAAELFPFYESALALRFRRYPVKWKRPLLFHLRRDGYARDGVTLDPDRPESLVYWWPKQGAPILVGFMYRAPLGRPPAFAGKLLAWHSHTENGSRGDNQMTHVWLTNDLRSALANCLPVTELQKAIPRFRYSRPSHGAGHEARRCRG